MGKKWEDTLNDFSYAASLSPDATAPQIGRSLVLYQLGRKSEATVYFRAMIDKYPDFADGKAAYVVLSYEKERNDGTPMTQALNNVAGKIQCSK